MHEPFKESVIGDGNSAMMMSNLRNHEQSMERKCIYVICSSIMVNVAYRVIGHSYDIE